LFRVTQFCWIEHLTGRHAELRSGKDQRRALSRPGFGGFDDGSTRRLGHESSSGHGGGRLRRSKADPSRLVGAVAVGTRPRSRWPGESTPATRSPGAAGQRRAVGRQITTTFTPSVPRNACTAWRARCARPAGARPPPQLPDPPLDLVHPSSAALRPVQPAHLRSPPRSSPLPIVWRGSTSPAGGSVLRQEPLPPSPQRAARKSVPARRTRRPAGARPRRSLHAISMRPGDARRRQPGGREKNTCAQPGKIYTCRTR